MEKKRKNNPKSKKTVVSSAQNNTGKVKKQLEPRSFFDKSDAFFTKYDQVWFWLLLGITVLFGILLYDPRVSAGGDDSEYMLSAHNFLKEFKFPGFQGPLYPMVLSLIDAVFGMSVPVFKTFSLISMAACMFFLYRAFRRRIPSSLLFITLLLTSVNSHVLYFASQTYSEAFYMFMQALFLLVFFRMFIDRENQNRYTVRGEIKRHLLLAAVLLAVILTRSIGYSAFLAVTGYFIVYRQWKNIGWFVVCFLACFGVYQLTKYVLWGDISIQASGQGSALLNKDFYKPELGPEDLIGFFRRFRENSHQYLSVFFPSMLGLRETFTSGGIFSEPKPWITVMVYLLASVGILFSFKRNRYLFFTGILAGLFLIITFVILQTIWNQYRLIVPVYPLMILILFSALYEILKFRKLHSVQFLLFLPAVIIFFASISDTQDVLEKKERPQNMYSGLTPDWLHYVKASAWVADNLPEEALVACRKPAISSVYGKGRKFYGIYRVIGSDFNAFKKRWESDNSLYQLIPAANMTEQMYNSLLGHCEARVLVGDDYYFAVSDRDFMKKTASYFPEMKPVSSPREMQEILEKTNSRATVYYPDSLLLPMQQKGVTHVLTANIRSNPNIKNGNTVNTVERTILFIQEKYPRLLQPVIQIGDPQDEPAEIHRFDWTSISK